MREKLAAQAHNRWGHWMSYLFSKVIWNEDGSVTIPASLVKRWTRQITTTYEELPDEEKESDRLEADKIIEICGK